jgi:hypothetical protein
MIVDTTENSEEVTIVVDKKNLGDWVVVTNNLYLVQDSDLPMYVIADDFQAALSKWQKFAGENDDCDPLSCIPSGVSLIAEHDELIL